jgi:hypothetical protein
MNEPSSPTSCFWSSYKVFYTTPGHGPDTFARSWTASDNPGTCMDVTHLASQVSWFTTQAFGALVEYRYNRVYKLN